MILSKLETQDEIVPWIAPQLVAGEFPVEKKVDAKADEEAQARDAKLVEERINSARLEGYQEGYLKGQSDNADNADLERTQILSLMRALEHPLTQRNDEVRRELLALSVSIARLIVKRELRADCSLYTDLIDNACEEYSLHPPFITVKMNPQDSVLLQAKQESSDENAAYKLISDTTLSPGSCLLETSDSFLDLSADTLIDRIALELENKDLTALDGAE